MPRSINNYLGKDLLATLDKDIESVYLDGDMLNVTLCENTTHVYLNEQDLVTLLEFLRSNLH